MLLLCECRGRSAECCCVSVEAEAQNVLGAQCSAAKAFYPKCPFPLLLSFFHCP